MFCSATTKNLFPFWCFASGCTATVLSKYPQFEPLHEAKSCGLLSSLIIKPSNGTSGATKKAQKGKSGTSKRGCQRRIRRMQNLKLEQKNDRPAKNFLQHLGLLLRKKGEGIRNAAEAPQSSTIRKSSTSFLACKLHHDCIVTGSQRANAFFQTEAQPWHA